MRSFSPYVNPCAVAEHIDRKECRYPGMDVELLDYMTKFLDINVKRVPVTDTNFNKWGGWGKLNETGDGLDGILGQVQLGKYDMAGVWFAITKPRARFTGYTHPILYTRSIGFILQKPQEALGMDASALLYKVFSPMIWTVILALFVGFIFLLWLAPNLRRWSMGKGYKSARDLEYEGVWGTICLALHQYHGNVSTNTVFGNVAMISAGFFFLFVSTLYEGVLVGTLMMKSNKLPFNSLSELSAQVMEDKYKLLGDDGAGNAFFWDLIGNPETFSHKQLNKTIEAKGIIIEPDLNKLLTMIEKDPMLVWPGQDKLSGTHFVKSRCGLIFQEDDEATFGIPAGFTMTHGSEWLDVFTPLLANTAAYIKHLEDKYVKHELETDRKECPVEAQKEGDPLTLRNMFGIIVISCLMFGASLLLLFAEIAMNRFRQHLLRRVTERRTVIQAKVMTVARLRAGANKLAHRRSRSLVDRGVQADPVQRTEPNGFYRRTYYLAHEPQTVYGNGFMYSNYLK